MKKEAYSLYQTYAADQSTPPLYLIESYSNKAAS